MTNTDLDKELDRLLKPNHPPPLETNSPLDKRPPPPENLPPGKKAEWVKERKMPSGKTLPAGYRLVNIDRKGQVHRKARGHLGPDPEFKAAPGIADQLKRDPISHRRGPYKVKKPKQPDTVKEGPWGWATARLEKKRSQKPTHIVDPKHAADIRDMLDQPLAFITAMRISAPAGSELLGVLIRSQEALLQARAFIHHFTYHPTME